jgi:hypothetical protein
MKPPKLPKRLFTPAFFAGLFCLAVLCSNSPSVRAAIVVRPTQASAVASQQFFCSAGYDHQECLQHVSRLQAVLVRYSAGIQTDWGWVLVRSEDWKPLLLKLNLDRRSPAFSSLVQRKTYLEESLFLPPANRAAELERIYDAPIDQLLLIAVSHEIGHAVCHDGNEDSANLVAEQLRSGKRPQCIEITKSLSGIQELYLSNGRGRLHPAQ